MLTVNISYDAVTRLMKVVDLSTGQPNRVVGTTGDDNETKLSFTFIDPDNTLDGYSKRVQFGSVLVDAEHDTYRPPLNLDENDEVVVPNYIMANVLRNTLSVQLAFKHTDTHTGETSEFYSLNILQLKVVPTMPEGDIPEASEIQKLKDIINGVTYDENTATFSFKQVDGHTIEIRLTDLYENHYEVDTYEDLTGPDTEGAENGDTATAKDTGVWYKLYGSRDVLANWKVMTGNATINGISTGSPVFYAPHGSGEAGQYLESDGPTTEGAEHPPLWVTKSTHVAEDDVRLITSDAVSKDMVYKTGNVAETITGNKTFTGETTFGDDVSITGEVGITGETTITGETAITGETTVNGDTTLNGEMAVNDGNAQFTFSDDGGLDVNRDVDIDGNLTLTAQHTVETDTVKVNVIKSRTEETPNTTPVEIQDHLHVTGNADVDGFLNVDGAFTSRYIEDPNNNVVSIKAATTNITKNVNIGTLGQNNVLSVTGTENVTGNITSSAGNLSATVGDVSAGQDVTAGRDLTVGRNANITGELTVPMLNTKNICDPDDDVVEVDDDLLVNGDVNLVAPQGGTANLSVGGNASITGITYTDEIRSKTEDKNVEIHDDLSVTGGTTSTGLIKGNGGLTITNGTTSVKALQVDGNISQSAATGRTATLQDTILKSIKFSTSTTNSILRTDGLSNVTAQAIDNTAEKVLTTGSGNTLTWQLPVTTDDTQTVSSNAVASVGMVRAEKTRAETAESALDSAKVDKVTVLNGTALTTASPITTAKWGTARNINIASSDGTGAGANTSVDGSSSNGYTINLPSTIKANIKGNLEGTADVAVLLGTSDIGGETQPIYLDNGEAKASTTTVGAVRTPVYLSSGIITAGTPLHDAAYEDVDTAFPTQSDPVDTSVPTTKAVWTYVNSSINSTTAYFMGTFTALKYPLNPDYMGFTTTSEYVGFYIGPENADNTKTLVTEDNKNSLGIDPGVTPAYSYNADTTLGYKQSEVDQLKDPYADPSTFPTPFTSIPTRLAQVIQNPSPNDYAFVEMDFTTPLTSPDEYRRYKWGKNSDTQEYEWQYEYTLNNSSYTQAQWGAINSGISDTKVAAYDTHINTFTGNPHHVTASDVNLGNVTNVSTVSSVTQGSPSNITSGAVYTALLTKVGKVSSSGTGYVSSVAIDSTDKTQLNVELTALPTLSGGASAVSGKYVSGVTVNDHAITVTQENLPVLSKGTTSGDGNVVTDVDVSEHTVTLTKGITALTQHQDISGKADVDLKNITVGGTVSNGKTIVWNASDDQWEYGEAGKVDAVQINNTTIAGSPGTDTSKVANIITGAGLTSSSNTIKAKLKSEQSIGTIGNNQVYAVGIDANGELAVNVPWVNNAVQQSESFQNNDYPILASTHTGQWAGTGGTYKSSGVTVNPSTGTITAPHFYNSTTSSSLDFIVGSTFQLTEVD